MKSTDIVKAEEAIKVLTELAKTNPEVLDKLHRPPGAGFGSNYSYYNRDCAEMVKRCIDIMLADESKMDQKLSVKDFKHKSRDSLSVMCWQGFKYLIDRMDTPDELYKKARAKIRVRKSGDGVRFSWIGEDIKKVMPTSTLPAKVGKKWKDDFDMFLEDAKEGDLFHRKDVELDTDDIEYIRRSVMNLPEFRVFKLNKSEIKIGRTI